jgi:hypothetical protein
MFNRWRRTVVVAGAAGVAIVAQLAAIAPATPASAAAAPRVSVAVTSHFRPVTGDVFVTFHGDTFSHAKVHGTITGAAAGEVAVLFGQVFPYNKPSVRLGSVSLTAAKMSYSFTVTPTLATRYSVRLFASGAPKSPRLATSRAVNIYVISNGFFKGGHAACARPTCHQTVRVFTIVPASILRAEMAKAIHSYFGLSLGAVSLPPPPKLLRQYGGHSRATRARRVSGTEFEHTVSFTFSIGGHSFSYAWLTCVHDTEAKDGLGLPGHHGCGAKFVPRTVAYLG